MKTIMENWKRYVNEQAAPSEQDRLRAIAAKLASGIKGKQGTQLPLTKVRTGDQVKLAGQRPVMNYRIELIGLLLQAAGGTAGAPIGDFVKNNHLTGMLTKVMEMAKNLAPEEVAKFAPIGAKLVYKQDALAENKLTSTNDQTSDTSVQTYVEYIVGMGDVQEGQFVGLKDKAVAQQKQAIAKLQAQQK